MDEQTYSTAIYENLKLKSTSELAAIWRENDHEAWADEAFMAIERILAERQEPLPSRELEPEMDEEEASEGVDTFHDPIKVFQIVTWMRWLAFALALSTIGYNLFYFFSTLGADLNLTLYNLLGAIYTLAEDLVKVLLLLGGSQLLLMLLDIETNTRQNEAGPDVE